MQGYKHGVRTTCSQPFPERDKGPLPGLSHDDGPKIRIAGNPERRATRGDLAATYAEHLPGMPSEVSTHGGNPVCMRVIGRRINCLTAEGTGSVRQKLPKLPKTDAGHEFADPSHRV
jgi:hypothetical protein